MKWRPKQISGLNVRRGKTSPRRRSTGGSTEPCGSEKVQHPLATTTNRLPKQLLLATCKAVSGASPVTMATACPAVFSASMTNVESAQIWHSNAMKPTNRRSLSTSSRDSLEASALASSCRSASAKTRELEVGCFVPRRSSVFGEDRSESLWRSPYQGVFASLGAASSVLSLRHRQLRSSVEASKRSGTGAVCGRN